MLPSYSKAPANNAEHLKIIVNGTFKCVGLFISNDKEIEKERTDMNHWHRAYGSIPLWGWFWNVWLLVCAGVRDWFIENVIFVATCAS
jgi:hypothetical protein